MAPARGATTTSRPRFRKWRFCNFALLATAAAVTALTRGGCPDGFVTSPATARSRFRGSRILRHADAEDEGQRLVDALLPADQLWQKPNKNVLLEPYSGARSWDLVFWATLVPPASVGFFIVGLSIWLRDQGQLPLVDMFPAVGQYFGNLRPTDEMTWWPGGMFMTFYGTGGLFLLSPLMLYGVFQNPGQGGAEFNKKTKKLTITRNGEVEKEVKFDDIDTIELEWSGGLFTGRREVYLKLNSGEPLYFMETVDEKSKMVLEKQASDLAQFMGKKLNYVDY